MVLISASAAVSEPEFHGTALRTSIGASYERREGSVAEADDGARSESSRVSRAASMASRAASLRSRMTGAAGAADARAPGGSVRSGLSFRSTRSVGAPVARRIGGKVELSEVDEMGLPLDGYDYGSHLSVGGGGLFIPAPGSSSASVASSRAGTVMSVSGGGGGARSVARSVRSHREDLSSADRNDAIMEGLLDTLEAAAALALPREALPSLPEDAAGGADVVTLREETLPIDLKELLDALEEGAEAADGEEDENEGAAKISTPVLRPIVVGGRSVEVLDDNFVLQAMGAEEIPVWAEGAQEEESKPAAAAFDFDAHVARLMALAEGEYGDDDDGLSYDDGLEGVEEGDDDDFGSGQEDDDDNHDESGTDDHAGSRNQKNTAADDSAKLERLLASYGDDDIGELQPDDPQVTADGFVLSKASEIESFAGERESSSAILASVTNDFIAARNSSQAAEFTNAAIEAIAAIKERQLLEYREARERERLRALNRNAAADSDADSHLNTVSAAAHAASELNVMVPKVIPPRSPSPVSSAAALAAAAATTALAAVQAGMPPRLVRESKQPAESEGSVDIPYGCAEGDTDTSQAPLVPPTWGRRVGRGHDVETVLSMRSSASHHPRSLTDPPASVVSTRSTSKAPRLLLGESAEKDGPVRVSKKTGLPVNVVFGVDARSGRVRVAPSCAMPPRSPLRSIDEPGVERGASGGGGEGRSDSEEYDDGSGDGSQEEERRPVSSIRPQNETAEQRRARKSVVRAERAMRRATKKETSRLFKREELRHITADAHKDPLAKGIALGIM